jgi:hypothetical protein
MNRLLLTVALTVMVGGAFYVTPTVAQLSPTTKKSCKRRDHPRAQKLNRLIPT